MSAYDTIVQQMALSSAMNGQTTELDPRKSRGQFWTRQQEGQGAPFGSWILGAPGASGGIMNIPQPGQPAQKRADVRPTTQPATPKPPVPAIDYGNTAANRPAADRNVPVTPEARAGAGLLTSADGMREFLTTNFVSANNARTSAVPTQQAPAQAPRPAAPATPAAQNLQRAAQPVRQAPVVAAPATPGQRAAQAAQAMPQKLPPAAKIVTIRDPQRGNVMYVVNPGTGKVIGESTGNGMYRPVASPYTPDGMTWAGGQYLPRRV